MLSKLKIKNWKNIWNGGFTLTELIVVMAVASIMLTAVIIQQNKWNQKLILDTEAYELAMMIRQAQIYSLGVREYTAGTGDKFGLGYGVLFTMRAALSNRAIFFADRDNDGKYDTSPQEELINETKYFTRGPKVVEICHNTVSNCTNHPSTGYSRVNITFFRPSPEAKFAFIKNNGSDFTPGTTISAVFLKIRFDDGRPGESVVRIDSNGQISVQ